MADQAEAVAIAIDHITSDPESILGRLQLALREGRVNPDKVNAYYKKKHSPTYKRMLTSFLEGTFFDTQLKGFEQWAAMLPRDIYADRKRYDEIWHEAFMCGENLEPTVHDYFMSRVETYGFKPVYGRSMSREEVQALPQTEQDNIRRIWIHEANKNSWEWR